MIKSNHSYLSLEESGDGLQERCKLLIDAKAAEAPRSPLPSKPSLKTIKLRAATAGALLGLPVLEA
jgi:hypothetical protein